MRKDTKSKKLLLTKQILRKLSEQHLPHAVGGDTAICQTAACSSGPASDSAATNNCAPTDVC